MKRMTRRRGWDSGGVSEIVGTILTLGLTVLLFSSIIAFVGRMPAPTKTTQISFVGRVEPSGAVPWSNGAEIFITHNGGRSLKAADTMIIITIDGNGTSYPVSTQGPATFISSDDTWDAGDVWKVSLSAIEVPGGAASSIDASIIDQERNAFVWSSKLQGGAQGYGPIIMEAWVDSDPATAVREPIQNNLAFTMYVRISDPNGDLDISSPTADLSRLGLGASVALSEGSPGVFQTTQTMGAAPANPGHYPATVRASDAAGHSSSRVVLLSLGRDIGYQPQIHLSAGNISFDPSSPTNGDDIAIRVKASNIGLGNATVRMEVFDGGPNGTLLDWTVFNIGGSPDEVTENYLWFNAGPGGAHHLYILATVTSRIPDADLTDNFLDYTLTIMPTLLLVDDDNHNGDERDTTRYLRESLDSGGFDYDLYTVPGGSGPSYAVGQTQLVDYDVVVWNTGYESVNTLTADDRLNLGRFLTETAGGRSSTGSLWMLGQHFLSEPSVSASGFASTYLKATVLGEEAGPSNPLRGSAVHPVAVNWSVPARYLNVTQRVAGEGSAHVLDPGIGAEPFFSRLDGRSDAVSYEDVGMDSRVVTFGWDFGRVADFAEQTDLAYAIVLWLGNLTSKNLVDFAVTGQTIMPETVYFKQPVTITAWIRNNGADDRNVSADVLLDGLPMADSLRLSIPVPGKGGKVAQSWVWNATVAGVHTLIVRVDPYNEIAEANEQNNRAGGLVTTTTINVLFRLLVVDDDGSADNGGALANETGHVTAALDGFGCEYEYISIHNGDSFPTTRYIENYSAVIWVTGEVEDALTAADAIKLADYISLWMGSVWLQGRNSTRQADPLLMSTYFGVGVTVQDVAIPSGFYGVTGDALGHGIHYGSAAGTCDAATPSATGAGYLEHSAGAFVGVRSMAYPTVANAFSFGDLADGGWQLPTSSEAREELAFLILDWFGRPDERAELKISCVDIVVSDLHPQIGNSYVLRATVRNLAGYGEASALVRFMDENTTIGSDSVGVTPNGESTAEIIWRPLATGKRTLSVLVDPLGETAEAFEWFNNNASYSTFVYFFFDDMEDGTGKWSHDATLMNINGEGPLDFLPPGYENVRTDVMKDWDYSRTNGVTNSSRHYHSYNESYYMEEPTGDFLVEPGDVLISFALDDSKSMTQRTAADSQTWLAHAKNAAKTLLDQLSDDSVCVSIWDFNGNNERRWSGPTARVPNDPVSITANPRAPVRLGDAFVSTINGSTIDGRQRIRDEINAMDNPSGTTILWDAIGEAYLDTEYYMAAYPGLMPVVVVLSDGADCQASDQAGIASNRIEGGSDYWSPWTHMAAGTQTVTEHKGKYTFNWQAPLTTTQWLRAMTYGGSMDTTRLGLLTPTDDIKIYTVGLGLEHHDMPPSAAITRTAWPGEIADNTYALCVDAAAVPPTMESGTLEYNLWRIANTSGAEYFYAQNADALEGVFEQLGGIISNGSAGFNQTRSIGSQPLAPGGSRASPSEAGRAVNSNKQAVSPEVTLSGYETAKLSFWHKYNMLPGGNGGVIGVEVWDAMTSSWKFLYIIPSGVYTGGLYYGYDVRDGFDNRIQWCFNGVSSGGTFGWDYVELDVLPYIRAQGVIDSGNPDHYTGRVRVAFNYIQFGGGTGAGWYLDDVKLRAGRGDVPVAANHKDIWALSSAEAHGGSYSWWNGVTGGLKQGIDNALTTIPIDLTSAVTATLSAHLKFNINTADGIPPDSLRVEVTPDGGASWYAINLGVRAAWGLSGSGADMDDGKLDGKTYTGIDPANDGWVEAGTLTRLNVDLSTWRGRQIELRFRIVTNNDPSYAHYASNTAPWGVYIDDVTLTGLTSNR